MEVRERDYLFDNLKALMLFLVAFGHTLAPYVTTQDSILRYIMQYIYLFHMPLFSFITGYFSKNVEKSRNTAVKNVLIPYVVLQGVYILMALLMIALGVAQYNTDIFNPSFLLPTSPFYYLLCVFAWKVFLKDLLRFRFALPLTIILGVLVSLNSNAGYHIGRGAIFSLLFFFLLGYYCTAETVARIRKIPKLFAVGILLLGVIPSVYLPYSFRNVRNNYETVHLVWWEGILYRLLFYAIAVLMMAALINLMSSKKNFFSRIGKNAILVYAASTFLAPQLYVLIDRYLPLSQNIAVNLICMIVFSAAVVFFASLELIRKIYDAVIGWINSLLFKKEEG